jgi:hypothetical protein
MSTPLFRREVEALYGFAFPESLYEFHAFVSTWPEGRLWDWMGLRLEGPLRLLSSGVDPSYADPLWQSRYYNDPPEFFTILSGDTDGLHWGYWIDDPNAGPTEYPIVHYYSRDAFEISESGIDLFDFLRSRIEYYQHDAEEYLEYEMETEEDYEENVQQLTELRSLLPRYTPDERPETGDDYLETYPSDVEREVIAETCEGMGIVVPPERYRPLSAESLGKPIQEQVAEAMLLLWDGYPGAALQLGKELWLNQDHRETCYSLMDAAYAALGRDLLRRYLAVSRSWRDHCDRGEAARKAARGED